ncbi:response regulator, partial [bacterium]|nr:response regulator [bacterium]
SLGVLAGGIAHDFNNLLTVISTNVSMAKMYGDLEDDISDMLGDAEKASTRARNLTQQLLAFAKGGKPIKRTVSIRRLLKDTAAFALSGSNVKSVCIVPENLWHISADEGQIGQVIQNLVINADQAMPGGGEIKLSAENMLVGVEDQIPLQEGRHVRVSVTDQGTGILKKHLNRIFDPFFTTKQKGSGLGLATSFSIIRRHNGYIAVDSAPEEGTEFKIIIPVASNLSESDQIQEEFTLPIGSGKILIMDDEKPIRDLLARLLKRLGYETMMTCNGERVLEEYKKSLSAGEPFDGVILDLTIPDGMGGKETMTRLQEIDPNVKAIVSTGYTNDPAISNYKDLGFMEFLPKPYKIQDLAAKLKSIMSNDK